MFTSSLDTGCLLLESVKTGQLLSETFDTFKDDSDRRHNLFKSLARIRLDLAKAQQPPIGSLTITHNGALTVSNRPLTLQLHWLENEGIPTYSSRDTTYTSADSYLLDVLAYHDSRMIHQPNALNDEDDARRQMAAISIMRSVMPHYVNNRTKRGPFTLELTDLHQSNIFVDDNWYITTIIDLE